MIPDRKSVTVDAYTAYTHRDGCWHDRTCMFMHNVQDPTTCIWCQCRSIESAERVEAMVRGVAL